MTGRRLPGLSLLTATALVAACTSQDDKAAAAAANASAALEGGQIAVARMEIAKALAARDDVSDYWLLSAHIAIAAQDYGGAFDSYENLLTLDRSNVEAMTLLCQIALSADRPERAERYASQLAELRPGDRAALTVKASLALKQGDKVEATRLLNQVLTAEPTNAVALIVQAKLLAANDDTAGAIRAAEKSLASPGDPSSRLALLKGLYLKTKDAAGYARTLARLARAYPNAIEAQLDYAANLYDSGDARAFATTARLLRLSRDDVGTAAAVLQLWLAHAPSAMPLQAITAGAADGSLVARATYAQYANEIGRPDIALAVLGDTAAPDPVTTANADAKIAHAYARALRGAPGPALAAIDAVLAVDADQPRALLARGRLRARTGNGGGALEDLRHALAGDKDNASARLALADLQLAQGDAVLAEVTLRDGLDGPGGDPRVLSRLMALLRSQGRGTDAAAVRADYSRANPFSRLARS